MLPSKTLLTSIIASGVLAAPGIGIAGGDQAFEQQKQSQAQAQASGDSAGYGGPLVNALKQNGKFTTFVKALDAADMTWVISKGGQHTVFAPTDEAFSKIPAKDLEALLKDKPKLQKVLSYHIAPNINYGWTERRDQVISMTGEPLKLQAKVGNTPAKVNNADMTSNMGASNGVIYGINQVLWPQS
jgi:uncharacterized surface protein with fasciclin (FAS1) repeats